MFKKDTNKLPEIENFSRNHNTINQNSSIIDNRVLESTKTKDRYPTINTDSAISDYGFQKSMKMDTHRKKLNKSVIYPNKTGMKYLKKGNYLDRSTVEIG